MGMFCFASIWVFVLMKIKMNIPYDLIKIPLVFEKKKINNIFKDKNNKTLKETIEHKRYANLSGSVYEKYSKNLNMPLGKFLFELKNNQDDLIKLNSAKTLIASGNKKFKKKRLALFNQN